MVRFYPTQPRAPPFRVIFGAVPAATATNGPSGGCSSASPAGRCACSAPTVMSSTHWCWAAIIKARARLGTQQRPAAPLSSTTALHRRFQRHDRTPGRPVRPPARQQGSCSGDVQAADPSWWVCRTCLKCSISPLNPPEMLPHDQAAASRTIEFLVS